MTQLSLMVLRPKAKTLGLGSLLVSPDGEAQFFGADKSNRLGGTILATMTRVRVECAADGMHITGMEPAGIDRKGNEKFFYQEWWLRHVTPAATLAAQKGVAT